MLYKIDGELGTTVKTVKSDNYAICFTGHSETCFHSQFYIVFYTVYSNTLCILTKLLSPNAYCIRQVSLYIIGNYSKCDRHDHLTQ